MRKKDRTRTTTRDEYGNYLTPSRLAKERDEFRCLWHLIVFEQIRLGTDSHHVFRPRQDYNETRYIVTLCHECHIAARHGKGSPSDREIVERVMIPYVWGGEDYTPHETYQRR